MTNWLDFRQAYSKRTFPQLVISPRTELTMNNIDRQVKQSRRAAPGPATRPYFRGLPKGVHPSMVHLYLQPQPRRSSSIGIISQSPGLSVLQTQQAKTRHPNVGLQRRVRERRNLGHNNSFHVINRGSPWKIIKHTRGVRSVWQIASED